jgi:hypothetical protein
LFCSPETKYASVSDADASALAVFVGLWCVCLSFFQFLLLLLFVRCQELEIQKSCIYCSLILSLAGRGSLPVHCVSVMAHIASLWGFVCEHYLLDWIRFLLCFPFFLICFSKHFR